MKKRWKEPEVIEKMSKRIPWNKGKTGLQDAWNKGKSWSDKTKRLISEKTIGRYVGEKSPLSKLSNKQRNEIIDYYKNIKITKKELAKKYNVSVSTIIRIIKRGKYE